MKKRLLFIYNPHSGTGAIKPVLSDILDVMTKAGYDVMVYPTQSSKDAVGKVAEEAGDFDRIVCAGGDGTLDEVVTGVMQGGHHIPIGYIPCGSTNDFGNSLGISKDMLKAAATAVDGTPISLDLGCIEEDYFVYVAAFGIFTETSYQTPQEMKNVLGHMAYVLEGVKQLKDVTSYRMQIETGGNVIYDEFIYGMVTNANSVGGFKGLVGENVDMSDGLFEVTLVRMPKNPLEFNDILSYLSGLSKDSEFVISFKTDKIKFISAEEVPWTFDGENGGKRMELAIENMNKAVEIVVES
ncbi:MAG: YegS/Rv2252/BmrU family lipid kinase [Lachnospiraceae bacterium]|nr:YegS/Rv2252/BmrU family lipid kinase [Lachnospiraceae bacterium]